MKEKMRIRNFMIYVLLVVFLITGSGMGLDAKQQVFSLCNHEVTSTIASQSLTSYNDLHTFEIRESSSAVFSLRGFQNNHTKSFCRCGLFFFCVLTVLSAVFRLVQETFALYSRLYIHERFYMITFMQDTDGRKKFS